MPERSTLDEWFDAVEGTAAPVPALSPGQKSKAKSPTSPAEPVSPVSPGGRSDSSETWFNHIEARSPQAGQNGTGTVPLRTAACPQCGFGLATTRICVVTGVLHSTGEAPAVVESDGGAKPVAKAKVTLATEALKQAEGEGEPSTPTTAPRKVALTVEELKAMGHSEDALFCLKTSGPPLTQPERAERFLKHLRLHPSTTTTMGGTVLRQQLALASPTIQPQSPTPSIMLGSPNAPSTPDSGSPRSTGANHAARDAWTEATLTPRNGMDLMPAPNLTPPTSSGLSGPADVGMSRRESVINEIKDTSSMVDPDVYEDLEDWERGIPVAVDYDMEENSKDAPDILEPPPLHPPFIELRPETGASKGDASAPMELSYPAILRVNPNRLPQVMSNKAALGPILTTWQESQDDALITTQYLRMFVFGAGNRNVANHLIDKGVHNDCIKLMQKECSREVDGFDDFLRHLLKKGGHMLDYIRHITMTHDRSKRLSVAPEICDLGCRLLILLSIVGSKEFLLDLTKQMGPACVALLSLCDAGKDAILPLLNALSRSIQARDRIIVLGVPQILIRIFQEQSSSRRVLKESLILLTKFCNSFNTLRRFARALTESNRTIDAIPDPDQHRFGGKADIYTYDAQAQRRSALDDALQNCTGTEDPLAACVTIVSKLINIIPRTFEVLISIVGETSEDDMGPRYLLLLRLLEEAYGQKNASVQEVKERTSRYVSAMDDRLKGVENLNHFRAKLIKAETRPRGFDSKHSYTVWSREKCHNQRFMGEGGCFSSINTAIRHAKPYQEIILTNGHFEEHVFITMPVIIRGTHHSIIQSPSDSMPAITIQCRDAVLLGISVKCARSVGSEEEDVSGVVIMEGTPTLQACSLGTLWVKGVSDPIVEDCAIEYLRVSSRGAGRYVGNEIGGHRKYSLVVDVENDVFPVFYRNNVVSKGKCGAVMFTGPGTSCRFAYNTITNGDNAALMGIEDPTYNTAGITVQNGAMPEIFSNVISSFQNGILIRQHATWGLFQGNQIRGNLTGIRVESRANPIIEQNLIWGNIHGIHVSSGGMGLISSNIIYGSTGPSGTGITCSHRGDPLCTDNTILVVAGDQKIGIQVQDDGLGYFVENEVMGSGSVGVLILRGGHPRMDRNYVNGPWYKSVEVTDEGQGRLKGNLITHARNKAVTSGFATAPYFEANVIAFACFRGLHIAGGKGTFVNNLIVRNSHVQVEIIGPDADPTLTRNTICDADAIGMLCTGHCKGTFSCNKIFAHGVSNLKIMAQANPLLIENSFHTSAHEGILITDGGKGMFKRNYISDNAGSGMIIEKEGEPELHDNQFHNGKGNGLWVRGGGNGLFTNNQFHANKGAGVKVSAGAKGDFNSNDLCKNSAAGIHVTASSDPTFTNNKIRCNNLAGILVSTSGKGMFEKNKIFGNLGPGIIVEHAGDPMVKENHVHDGPMGGIVCRENAKGTFDHNRIQSNRRPGITASTGAESTFTHNDICDGEDCGVCIIDSGKGLFMHNTIHGNAEDGVRLCAKADARFVTNDIYDEVNGIVSTSSSAGGFFEKNEIRSCLISNIQIKKASVRLVFLENSIHDSLGPGIDITGGMAQFVLNAIQRNAVTGIRVNTSEANPVFSRNTIKDHTEFGMDIRDKGKGLYVGNTYSGNLVNVCVQTGAVPILDNNMIRKAEKAGILVMDHGLGYFRENTIESNTVGVEILLGGDPVMEENRIAMQTGEGVIVHRNGEGSLIKNEIEYNCKAGVKIEVGANPCLVGNEVKNGSECGILIQNGGNGHISQNKIFKNGGPGILCQNAGQPIAQDNEIHDGLKNGVLVRDGGYGKFFRNCFRRNKPSGLCVETGGDPRVDSNLFEDNVGNWAVTVWHQGRGLFVNNHFASDGGGVQITCQGDPRFHGNSFESELVLSEGALGLYQYNDLTDGERGMTIRADAHPVIQFNKIHGQKQCGVLVCDNGKGIIRHNVLTNNTVGVEVHGKGHPTVELNLIHENQDGVHVHHNGMGQYSRNNIYANSRSGFLVTHAGSPLVESNWLHDGMTGIMVEQGGTGKYTQNLISNNQEQGFRIQFHACPHVHKNFVYGNTLYGLDVSSEGKGTIQGNTIFRNGVCGIRSSQRGQPTVSENQIWGEKNGILVENKGAGEYEDNRISLTTEPGIFLRSGARPILKRNWIFSCEDVGIATLEPDTEGLFEGNEIFGIKGRAAVVIADKSNPTLKENDISDGIRQGVGIVVENNGKGNIERNTIHRLQMGILGLGPCDPVFKTNHVHSCAYGVVIRNGQAGVFKENRMNQCKRAGILVEESGKPLADKNVVSDNTVGIMIQDKGLGNFKENIFFDNYQWAAEISEAADPDLLSNKFFSPTSDPPIPNSNVVMKYGVKNDIRTEIHVVKDIPTCAQRAEIYNQEEQQWRKVKRTREQSLALTLEIRDKVVHDQIEAVKSHIQDTNLSLVPSEEALTCLESQVEDMDASFFAAEGEAEPETESEMMQDPYEGIAGKKGKKLRGKAKIRVVAKIATMTARARAKPKPQAKKPSARKQSAPKITKK